MEFQIRNAAQECKTAFTHFCAHGGSGQSWARSAQGNFNLWCAELKVTSLDDTSTLDHRLRKKENVRNIIRDLLRGLSGALDKCRGLIDTIPETEEEEEGEVLLSDNLGDETEQHSHGRSNRDTTGQAQSDSDRNSPLSWDAISNESSSGGLDSTFEKNASTDNGESGSSALAEQVRYILTIIEQLMRSSLVIREAGNKYRFQEADAELDEEAHDDFRKHLTAVILMAFEDRDAKTLTAMEKAESIIDHKRLSTVQARLVHANLLRRNRIQWNTRHSFLDRTIVEKMLQTSAVETTDIKRESDLVVENLDAPPIQVNKEKETPSVVRSVSFAPPQTVKKITRSLVSAKTATDVDSQLTGKHIFFKGASSTATQMTRIGKTLAYPRSPMPDIGGSLRCPYCNKALPGDFAKTDYRDRWGAHVVHDVVPYSCIAELCETPDEMYLTSETLLAHMLAKHAFEQWTCDYCRDPSPRFDTAEEWEEHVALQHPSIVPAENRVTFAQLNKRAMIGPLGCPLCPHTMEGSDTTLDDHILRHLHEFALRSLPGHANLGGEPNSDLSQASGKMSHTGPNDTGNRFAPWYPTFRLRDVQNMVNQHWLVFNDIRGTISVPSITSPRLRDPVAVEWWNFHAQVLMGTLEFASFLQSGLMDSSREYLLELNDKATAAIDQMNERFPLPVRVIVSIDFGTTHSAIAWARTDEPGNLNVVNRWGLGTPTANKAPTTVCYENGGSTGSFKWGFQAQKEARRGAKIHEWFKLGLWPEYKESHAAVFELNGKYQSFRAIPPSNDVSNYEGIIVDYLKSIRYHLEEQLMSVDSVSLAKFPRQYIITVPKIWDQGAQNRLRSCAEEAGLGIGAQLHLISESEADAVWALNPMPKLEFEVGDTFVVCNAGGSIVDLASYTIEALQPTIKLAGATKGISELCGGGYLNRIFRKHLQDRMAGYHGGWDEKYLDLAVDKFETTIKPEFTGKDNDDHSVYMPSLKDSRSYRVNDGSLLLEGKELREHVFNPVIDGIAQLVEDQIANTPSPVKRVLLAGGFGQSAYLKQQLQQNLLIQHRRISIEHIDQSDTSIVRGALITGLARHEQMFPSRNLVQRAQIVSRIAAKSWGTCAFDSIRNRSDQARAKIQPGGEYLVECMQWFIQEESRIKDLESKTFPFHKEQSVYSGPIGEVTIDIYEFSKPLANDNPAPRYPDDPGVKKCLSLTMDLTGMDVPVETHNDHPLYVARFEILVMLESASLSFSGRYNGKEFPAKSLTFS